MKHKYSGLTPDQKYDLLTKDFLERDGDTFVRIRRNNRIGWEDTLPEDTAYSAAILSPKDERDLYAKAMTLARQMITSMNHPYRVNVRVDPNRSCTDSHDVYVATKVFDDPDLSLGQKLDTFLGLTVHEGSHLLYTDFNQMKSIRTKLVHTLQNIFEDERIERELGEQKPGLANFLKATKYYYFGKYREKKEEVPQDKPIRLFNAILCMVRYPAGLVPDEVREFADELLETRDILTPFPASTAACIRCAEKVAEIIKRFMGEEKLREEIRRRKRQQKQQQSSSKEEGQQQEENGQGSDDEQDGQDENQEGAPSASGGKPSGDDSREGNGSGKESGDSNPEEDESREDGSESAGRQNEEEQGTGSDASDDNLPEDGGGSDGNSDTYNNDDTDDNEDTKGNPDTGENDREDGEDTDTDGNENGDDDEDEDGDESSSSGDGEEEEDKDGDEDDTEGDTDGKSGNGGSGNPDTGEGSPSSDEPDDEDDEDVSGAEPLSDAEAESILKDILEAAKQLSSQPSGEGRNPLSRDDASDTLNRNELLALECEKELTIGHEAGTVLVPQRADKTRYDASLQRVRKYIPAVAQALRAQGTEYKYKVSGTRSGMLDTNRLAEARQGVQNVYMRKGEVKCDRISIALLIDESGSMYGQRAQMARDTAVLVNEAVGTLRYVDLYIYGYTTGGVGGEAVNVLFPYRENHAGDRYALGAISDRGGTPTAQAVSEAAWRIRKNTQSPAILIVVSDGYADGGWQEVRRATDEAKKRNIETVGISISSNLPESSLKLMYDRYIDMHEVKDLASELGRTIRDTILKTTKRHVG